MTLSFSLVEPDLVDFLSLEKVGIARIENPHFLKHLADNDFDVFVVNFNRLQAIYVLDLVHKVLLNHVNTLDLQDVVGIDRTFRQPLSASI